MYYNMGINKRTISLFLLVLFCVLFITSMGKAAQQLGNITMEGAEYAEMTGPITSINRSEEYLVVGGKQFYLAESTQNDHQYKTKLLSTRDRDITFDAFRVDEIVVVIAVKVKALDGRHAAFVVKKLPPHEVRRFNQGLKYDSTQLMHKILDNVRAEDKIDPHKIRHFVKQYGGKGNQ